MTPVPDGVDLAVWLLFEDEGFEDGCTNDPARAAREVTALVRAAARAELDRFERVYRRHYRNGRLIDKGNSLFDDYLRGIDYPDKAEGGAA